MSAPAPPGKLRVLIAEDNKADVLLIQEALLEHGLEHEAEIVSNGEQALAFLERMQLDPDPPLHLVLLDLNLGTHHGADVLARIRTTPGTSRVPVVVLTSSDSPSDRQRVQSLGADLYLRKPMDLDAFLGLGAPIAQMLSESGFQAPQKSDP
jgi:two-component system, chemotaxis family, response regulator Rcp1